MAVYDQSVRQLMVSAGYDNSKIGHDAATGYVTYDGNPFMKAQKYYQNTNYTDLPSFKNADTAYQTKLKAASAPSTPAGTATNPYGGTYGPSYVNPQDEQINTLLKQLTDKINNPTPYNVYGSPEYAAYQAQANLGAQNSIRQGQEALGTSGMARSTDLVNWAQNAQNDANQYLQTQVVPQLIAQNDAKQQQGLQNLLSLLNQAENQQGVYDTRNQNAITNRASEKAANLNAANIVSQLTGKLVNPTDDWGGLYRQAGNSNTPLTMAGKQNELANSATIAGLTGYFNGKPTTAEQQRTLTNLWTAAEQTGRIPDELAAMYGLPKGTQTQAAKQFAMNLAIQQQQVNISQQNANTNSRQVDAGIDMDLLNYGLKANPELTTSSQNNVSEISTNINRAITGMGSTFDSSTPEGKQQIEKMIVTQTADPVTAVQLYNMYGIPIPTDLQAEYTTALKKANP